MNRQPNSHMTFCLEEISRASGRIVKEIGWGELGLSKEVLSKKRKRAVSDDTPRARRAQLPAWKHLDGLLFGVLANRWKAVQLASYCRAAGLHPDSGRKSLESWANHCQWPAAAVEKQGGSSNTGAAEAYFVAVKCLKKLHRKRQANQL